MSVWSEFDRNAFWMGQLAAMRPHLSDAAADAYRATSVASLGGLDGLGASLRKADFADVVVEERQKEMQLPPISAYFPTLVAARRWREAFERLTAAQRKAVLDRLDTFVDDSPNDDGCSVHMTVAVAAGRRRSASVCSTQR
jgi:hypothetical protein